MQDDGSAGTVLAVDDDKVVLSLITSLLEAAGYMVLQAEDGLAGWEVLSDRTGPPGTTALASDR